MKKRKKEPYHYIGLMTLLFVVVSLVLVVFFIKYAQSIGEKTSSTTYSSYYGMIVPDRNSALWKSVYEGALTEALQKDTYVELMGENLARDFERSELLQIAITANMDGIILVADESEEMKNLIHMASAEKIPVVTLYTDCPDSERCSFVGLSKYNLGKEYGNQLLTILRDRKYVNKSVRVAILMNANFQDQGQNILVSGIQESIETLYSQGLRDRNLLVELNYALVDEADDLSVEETVRKLLISNDETPDVIVCLNEMETNTVYQTVVDYNKVGEVNILGYYVSEPILQAIRRNVIHSTIAVDTQQMGQACILALNEYRELGNTSQYFPTDITLIDKNNVEAYLEEAQP